MPDHRPLAHLLPRSGWTNDPIGPVRWRGRTHLFNQVNPSGPFWERPQWGHFVTDDLVHWQRRPIALSPDPEGPDADGCYSGCVTVIDGAATMFYTGARGLAPDQVQTTCVARSTDEHLDTWVKDATNPVTTAPEGVAPDSFRDPFVWRDGDRWLQLVGAAIPGEGGAALLYASHDLISWDYLGPMLRAADLPGEVWTGEMWECPALLRTPQGGDALLISVHDGADATFHAAAIVGSVDGDRFRPRNVHRFDHGPDLYAPCLHVDPAGRAIVWGWSWEARTAERQRDAGWAGVLTLPREVRVVGDEVVMSPLPEIDRLRTGERGIERTPTVDGWLAVGAEGDALDLQLTVGGGGTVALRLRRSPDLQEHTTVGLDLGTGRVWLDRDHASLDPQTEGGRYEAPVRLDGGPVELRVIADRSIVEVFVADQVALTARIYPSRDDSTGVEVVAPPGAAGSVQLRAWDLGSVWAPEGRQTP